MTNTSLTENIVIDILITLAAGSSAAAAITFFGNRWIKSREEKVDMSKQKRNKITNLSPLYSQLGSGYNELSYQLVSLYYGHEPDSLYSFYSICIFLNLSRRLVIEHGGLVLDDIDAEFVVEALRMEVQSLFGTYFDDNYLSGIASLVEDQNKLVSYADFCKDLEIYVNKKNMYNEFRYWILTESNEIDLLRLADEGRWFYQLISFEMNQVFIDYYGGNMQSLDDLEDRLIKFLETDYKDYKFYEYLSISEKEQCDKHFTNYYNRIQWLEGLRRRNTKWLWWRRRLMLRLYYVEGE